MAKIEIVGRIQNQSSVRNARYGMVGGKTYLFTHRNPATGDLWAEDVPVHTGDGLTFGKWIKSGSVRLI